MDVFDNLNNLLINQAINEGDIYMKDKKVALQEHFIQ